LEEFPEIAEHLRRRIAADLEAMLARIHSVAAKLVR
jgi:hypothetical protein